VSPIPRAGNSHPPGWAQIAVLRYSHQRDDVPRTLGARLRDSCRTMDGDLDDVARTGVPMPVVNLAFELRGVEKLEPGEYLPKIETIPFQH
jgi:hypothetical protein